MRNKQLKVLCREYGLHVSGNRSILLDRLCKHGESIKNDSEVSDSVEEDDIAVDEAIAACLHSNVAVEEGKEALYKYRL